jgi:hypothetical protein
MRTLVYRKYKKIKAGLDYFTFNPALKKRNMSNIRKKTLSHAQQHGFFVFTGNQRLTM